MTSVFANRESSFRLAGFLALTLLLLAAPAHAQGDRLGVFLGGSLSQSRPVQGPAGQTLQISSAFAAGLHYDHGFKLSRLLAPRLELELTVVPPRVVKSSAAIAVPRNYSALFITPGLAVEFFPLARMRPWIVAGGGYVLFLQSEVLTNGQKFSVHVKNGGAFDYGGGLDFGLWRSRRSIWSINLRAQVRDFVSSNPELNVPLQSGVQHNVVAAGGILFAL